jgi:hypothetical protein
VPATRDEDSTPKSRPVRCLDSALDVAVRLQQQALRYNRRLVISEEVSVRRLVIGLLAFVAVAVLAWPSTAHAQAKPAKYEPLSNSELAKTGVWDKWVATFREMTPKQKAEVMRRHIKMCLDSFELTDEQRTFVKESAAKLATEDVYANTTDPEKRAAVQKEMQPIQAKALTLLGRDLTQKIFAYKPPLSVLEAVKIDPAFK